MSEQEHAGQREAPKCISIVICNEVIEDKRTNSKTLVSLFNQINTAALPYVHPRMYIVGSFTDGIGKWPIGFRVSDPDNEEIFRIDGEAQFDDPFDVLDIVFEVVGLPIKKPGTHFVDVLIGNQHEVGRRFSVQLIKKQ